MHLLLLAFLALFVRLWSVKQGNSMRVERLPWVIVYNWNICK